MRFLHFVLFAFPFLHLFWGATTVSEKPKSPEPPIAANPAAVQTPAKGQ